MKLFTGQGFDLRTFRGPIDRARSTYADDGIIHSSIDRISEVLKTDQYLWASPTPLSRFGKTASYRFDHVIDVDDVDVLAVVVGWVWHCIIESDDSIIVPDRIHRRHANAVGRPNQAEHRKWLSIHAPKDPYSQLLRPLGSVASLQYADDLLIRWPFIGGTTIVEVTENAKYLNK